MKHRTRRFFSILLILTMMMQIMPAIKRTATVEAAAAVKAIQLVKDGAAGSIPGGQNSLVYFGQYEQGYFNQQTGAYVSRIDPIKWRVLNNGGGQLFLLSDQTLDFKNFNETTAAVTWETSTIRSWLNGYGTASGGSFISKAFNTMDQWAIADTEVKNPDSTVYYTAGGNDTVDKIFLLSLEEATNTAYGFTGDVELTDTRGVTNSAYVANVGKGTQTVTTWWLRTYSKSSMSTMTKLHVKADGSIPTDLMYYDSERRAVRPALNLDLSRVLMVSSAVPAGTTPGGKNRGDFLSGALGGFDAVENYTGNSWKLTLLDENRSGFNAELASENGNVWTITYSGATVGDNEYISALITDNAGTVTYYGRLKKLTTLSDASGSVSIDVSGKLNAGDKLYVFNEQHNGQSYSSYGVYEDIKADYSSALKLITKEAPAVPAVIKQVSLTMGERIDANVFVTVPDTAVKAVMSYSYPQSSVEAEKEYIFTDLEEISANSYMLSVENIPAKELTETMSFVVLDGAGNRIPLEMKTAVGSLNENENVYRFKAADYAKAVINSSKTNAKQKTQAKSLLNYGHMAQLYFNHKTDDLANLQGYLANEMNQVTADASFDGTFPTGSMKKKLGYSSMSLNFKGVLQIYLTFSKAVTATENGVPLEVIQSGSTWTVVIDNVRARHLHQLHQVVVSDITGTNRFTFKVAGLTYANKILASSTTSDAFKNLARALYIYHEKTLALFGEE